MFFHRPELFLFHKPAFFAFFAVFFAVYWALPWHRARMGWLLAASCFFYMSWNPWLISLILFSASVDYFAALLMVQLTSPARRRLLLMASISTNLCLLGFFKYTNFFLDTAYTSLNLFGLEMHRSTLQIILPLGISFYTFETIAYIVEVYQGKVKPVRNLLDYAIYIMFFPHLIAGPIVRPRDFLPQIGRRKRFSWNRMYVGAQFFLRGFFKKAIIADHLAKVVDPVFDDPTAYGSSMVWLAVLSYAVQIYCDFSGYSDMAVGAAHTLGFKLPLNFNMPYFAANISEFWKRWHISLSSWLRDYVYIPLGGNRGGAAKTYRNLILTMLIGGLWHGANWTFVAWGLFHGVLLAAHKALPLPRWCAHPLLRPLSGAVTFLCVCIGWVFFRAQSFGDAATILQRMFHPCGGSVLASTVVTAAVALLLLTLLCHLIGTFVNLRAAERRLPAFAVGAALAVIVTAAILFLPDDGRKFIYFQF